MVSIHTGPCSSQELIIYLPASVLLNSNASSVLLQYLFLLHSLDLVIPLLSKLWWAPHHPPVAWYSMTFHTLTSFLCCPSSTHILGWTCPHLDHFTRVTPPCLSVCFSVSWPTHFYSPPSLSCTFSYIFTSPPL